MTRKINIANPNDRSMLRRASWMGHGWQSYLFAFGANSGTYVLAYASDLNSALEVAAAWLAMNAPGHLLQDCDLIGEFEEACVELGIAVPAVGAEWGDAEHCAWEKATADLTYTEAGYLTSWEWAVSENPSKQALIALAKG